MKGKNGYPKFRFSSTLNENKYCHYLTKLNISRNTVSWVFENVVIATTTIVMKYLLTLVK